MGDEQLAVDLVETVLTDLVVVAHHPSELTSSDHTRLVTYDDADEMNESIHALCLLFPAKYTVTKLLRSRQDSSQRTYLILSINKHYTAEEAMIRVCDFLGEDKIFLTSIAQLFRPGSTVKERDVPVLVELYAHEPAAGENVLIKWFPKFFLDDFILPRDFVVETQLIERLKQFGCVRSVSTDQKHGCFHRTGSIESMSIRVHYFHAASTHDYRRCVNEIVEQAMQCMLGEVQVRQMVPWERTTYDMSYQFSTFDLRGFEPGQIEQVVNTLRDLRIRHYFLSATRLVLEGSGSFVNQLRLQLLHMNVSLPFGERALARGDRLVIRANVSALGCIPWVPVQIDFGFSTIGTYVLQQLIDAQEASTLSQHSVCSHLVSLCNAANFQVDFIIVGGVEKKCLLFDLPRDLVDAVPIGVDFQVPTEFGMDRFAGQIRHRGRVPMRPIMKGPAVEAENKRQHWQNLMFNQSQHLDCRRNTIAFREQSPASHMRFAHVRDIVLGGNTELMFGLEVAPWFFFPCPTSYSRLSSVLEDVLNRHDHAREVPLELQERRSQMVIPPDPTQHTVASRTNVTQEWRWFLYVLKSGRHLLKQCTTQKGKIGVITASSLELIVFTECMVQLWVPPGVSPGQLLEISASCFPTEVAILPNPDGMHRPRSKPTSASNHAHSSNLPQVGKLHVPTTFSDGSDADAPPDRRPTPFPAEKPMPQDVSMDPLPPTPAEANVDDVDMGGDSGGGAPPLMASSSTVARPRPGDDPGALAPPTSRPAPGGGCGDNLGNAGVEIPTPPRAITAPRVDTSCRPAALIAGQSHSLRSAPGETSPNPQVSPLQEPPIVRLLRANAADGPPPRLVEPESVTQLPFLDSDSDVEIDDNDPRTVLFAHPKGPLLERQFRQLAQTWQITTFGQCPSELAPFAAAYSTKPDSFFDCPLIAFFLISLAPWTPSQFNGHLRDVVVSCIKLSKLELHALSGPIGVTGV